eukprot:tig00000607_g2525.t1
MDRIRRGVDLRPFNAAFFGFCTLAAHAVTSRLVLGLVGLGWALQLTFFRFVLVAALHTAAIFTYARLLTVGSDTRVVRWHVGYGAFLAATVASGASTLVLLGAGDDWLVSCDGHAHPHKALGLLCGGRPSYLAALLGLLMALLFAARVVRRKELRLRFQSVVRPRYFRVKAAYLESLLDGPREGAAAALAALLAHLALRVAGLAQASLLPSAADAVGLVAAAAWCRVAWLAGARVAQSICGQPIPVEGPATAAAAALLGAAPPTDHPVLLHLLLQHWAAATRWPAHRAALFRDATGAALGHVVRSCTAIVDAFARDIAEKPPQAATAPAPAPAVAAPRPAGAGGSPRPPRQRRRARRLRRWRRAAPDPEARSAARERPSTRLRTRQALAPPRPAPPRPAPPRPARPAPPDPYPKLAF